MNWQECEETLKDKYGQVSMYSTKKEIDLHIYRFNYSNDDNTYNDDNSYLVNSKERDFLNVLERDSKSWYNEKEQELSRNKRLILKRKEMD